MTAKLPLELPIVPFTPVFTTGDGKALILPQYARAIPAESIWVGWGGEEFSCIPLTMEERLWIL